MCDHVGLDQNPIAVMSVEEFHGITLAASAWDPLTSYQAFHTAVNKSLACNTTLGKDAQKTLQRLAWRKAWQAMFIDLKTPSITRTVRRLADEAYYKCTDAMGQARRQVGSKRIALALDKDFTQLAPMVDTFLGRVKDYITEKRQALREQQDRVEEEEDDEGGQEDLPPPPKKMRKERSFWTAAEDAILIQGKKKGVKWIEIAKGLPGRSNVNCKDRHLTLLGQGKMV